MSAVHDDGNGVVFVQLSGAYWLDTERGECRECGALFAPDSSQRAATAGERWSTGSGLGRLYVVILPVAVLTFTAAVLLGVLS
ncbi:hypothetical protein ACIRVK_44285 [Streptomyces sp. NPDC101152]|uniref:hypothetical protein n=1 Tax=Streptomyces sp. NPDC101152 TaxID=3366116 RepID=UPI003824F6AB